MAEKPNVEAGSGAQHPYIKSRAEGEADSNSNYFSGRERRQRKLLRYPEYDYDYTALNFLCTVMEQRPEVPSSLPMPTVLSTTAGANPVLGTGLGGHSVLSTIHDTISVLSTTMSTPPQVADMSMMADPSGLLEGVHWSPAMAEAAGEMATSFSAAQSHPGPQDQSELGSHQNPILVQPSSPYYQLVQGAEGVSTVIAQVHPGVSAVHGPTAHLVSNTTFGGPAACRLPAPISPMQTDITFHGKSPIISLAELEKMEQAVRVGPLSLSAAQLPSQTTTVAASSALISTTRSAAPNVMIGSSAPKVTDGSSVPKVDPLTVSTVGPSGASAHSFPSGAREWRAQHSASSSSSGATTTLAPEIQALIDECRDLSEEEVLSNLVLLEKIYKTRSENHILGRWPRFYLILHDLHIKFLAWIIQNHGTMLNFLGKCANEPGWGVGQLNIVSLGLEPSFVFNEYQKGTPDFEAKGVFRLQVLGTYYTDKILAKLRETYSQVMGGAQLQCVQIPTKVLFQNTGVYCLNSDILDWHKERGSEQLPQEAVQPVGPVATPGAQLPERVSTPIPSTSTASKPAPQVRLPDFVVLHHKSVYYEHVPTGRTFKGPSLIVILNQNGDRIFSRNVSLEVEGEIRIPQWVRERGPIWNGPGPQDYTTAIPDLLSVLKNKVSSSRRRHSCSSRAQAVGKHCGYSRAYKGQRYSPNFNRKEPAGGCAQASRRGASAFSRQNSSVVQRGMVGRYPPTGGVFPQVLLEGSKANRCRFPEVAGGSQC